MPVLDRKARPTGMLLSVYSIPGSGKTKSAAALMRWLWKQTGKRSLYGDWDMGELAIPETCDECFDLWQPDPDKDPIDEAMEFMDLAASGDYAMAVTDTISMMGSRFLHSVAKKQIFEKSDKRGVVKTEGGREMKIATLSDYGHAQMQFEQWALENNRLFQQGKHVMWLAHEKLVDIKDAGGAVTDVIGGPEVIGSALTRVVPKLPHFNGRIKCKAKGGGAVEFWLQTCNDGYYQAKDRLCALAPGGLSVHVGSASGPEDLNEKILQRWEAVWADLFRQRAKVGKSVVQDAGSPGKGGK